MPKLTIVAGLPGAGKSTYCRANAPQGRHYGDVCHPHKTSGPGGLGDVVIDLMSGNDCLIEDVSFCEAGQRDRVEKWIKGKVPGVQIEWVCFEMDFLKCFSNISDDFLRNPNGRDHRSRFICLFDMMEKECTIPENVKIIEVTSSYKNMK